MYFLQILDGKLTIIYAKLTKEKFYKHSFKHDKFAAICMTKLQAKK